MPSGHSHDHRRWRRSTDNGWYRSLPLGTAFSATSAACCCLGWRKLPTTSLVEIDYHSHEADSDRHRHNRNQRSLFSRSGWTIQAKPLPRAISAYGGLDLHSDIARAASQLYQDGHSSNAVEDAVKALNVLVRSRSRLEIDGVPLMQKAFSPNALILRFNDLSDQSDRDEQLGFMNMFSGAVSGLRKPAKITAR
jgi:uncharacterized protein (TIGR02391 family)